MTAVRPAGALAMLWLTGCAASPDVSVLLEADEARTGVAGDDGPLGAGLYAARTLTRVDDLVRYEVVVPLDSDGGIVEATMGPLPVVVMIHGGFVEVRRYRWLGAHLATRGYVTVLADHDANLSFLSSFNSTAALEDVFADSARLGHPLYERLDPTAPASVLGHSLGGVAAATLWADDPSRWDVLGILASFPAAGTDVEQLDGRPSVHLVGSEDEPDAKRDKGFERFSPPRVFGVIDGMNHYAWTDDATDSELAGDGPLLRSVEAVRQDALNLLDTTLDAWMRDDTAARERLDAGAFPGVQVAR